MATGSIKSQTNAQRRKDQRRARETGARADETNGGVEISERAFLAWSIAVMAVAVALRVYLLEMKPLHHDEGVNGFFFTKLFRENSYQYDPGNYHGPSLYYLTLPFANALGLTTLALRLTTVLFGTATVWLALLLRRYIGTLGALSAAALIAVSPGAVYLSRYYIHESLFVFFTLAGIVAALRYYDGAREGQRYDMLAGMVGTAAAIALVILALTLALNQAAFSAWMISVLKLSMMAALVVTIAALQIYAGARAIYLILAFISTALLFATKETAFISAGVVLLASLLAHGFVKIRKDSDSSNNRKAKNARRSGGQTSLDEAKSQFSWRRQMQEGGSQSSLDETLAVNRLSRPAQFALALFIGAGIFLFLNIALYSSFFSNVSGVADSLKTFAIWTETGKSDFHRKGFTTYLGWLWQEEAALLALGALGACFAVWRARRKDRFPLFAAAWAFGILAAYSLVPYKTPWLALNFIVPLAITSGYAIDVIGRRRLASPSAIAPREHYVNFTLAAALMAASLALGAYQSVTLNFLRYDDDRYPYVYAHTMRDTHRLTERVAELVERAGTGNETRIAILSPEYWPLPWYFREYDPNAAFHGRMIVPTNEHILILREDQARESEASLGDRYRRVGAYTLRPGVNLVLYAQRELMTR